MKVKIDGKELNFNKKITILNAARSIGIDIPSLCYDDRLSPYGSCRLCLVNIKNKGIVTSCNTYIDDGMEIETENEEINKLRVENLKLLLHKYPKGYDKKYADKRFHELIKKYGLEAKIESEDTKLIDSTHPLIYVNMNRCINCYNCVRACEDIVGKLVWRSVNRGYNTLVIAEGNKLGNSSCISCRMCIDVCPSGAIEDSILIKNVYPQRWIDSTCSTCSIACPVKIGLSNNDPSLVKLDDKKLKYATDCLLGEYHWEDTYYSIERIYYPLIRAENNFLKTNYDHAINYLASNIKDIISKYGPDKIGFLVANRLTMEEYYVLQKLGRDVIKTNNIGSNLDICFKDDLNNLLNSIGFVHSSIALDKLDESKVVFVVGEIDRYHPALSSIIRKISLQGKTSLIVIDSLNSNKPIHNASDIYINVDESTMARIFKYINYLLIKENRYDREYINNIENLNSYYKKIENEIKNKEDLIPIYEKLDAIFRLISENKPITFIVELNNDNELSKEIINTYLLSNNSKLNNKIIPLFGSCDLIDSLYMGVSNKFEPGLKPSNKTGLDGLSIIEKAEKGEIKGLIVVGNSLLNSNLYREKILKALKRVDFIAQITPKFDIVAKYYAKLIIPSPTSLEKDGHYLSIDMKIRKSNKAIDNGIKQEFNIFNEISKSLNGFYYKSNEEVWNEIGSINEYLNNILINKFKGGYLLI
ncbi:MAG: hypothetical protein C0171_00995 [Caldisphaera sp.]|nr:MAG: hypothetical protein C0201_01595 [Caldisphaera sp.]PMP92264.1 MAG: hypothetical protein C0171_00995 [Caldisphaera sp.]